MQTHAMLRNARRNATQRNASNVTQGGDTLHRVEFASQSASQPAARFLRNATRNADA